MPRKVFIAGERGQMAYALARAYSARGDAVMTAGRTKADIVDAVAVQLAILGFNPDIVINAAAYTAVDQAEDDADEAYLINCKGAGHIAAGARVAGALLIHISTDYVFDGSKPTPYVETDAPNPIGVYGRSKLAGEKAVTAEAADHIIVRTSWLYSEIGTNFVKTMLRLASERDEISIVDDQWGTPTFAADLASAIADIGEQVLSASDRSALCGIYHAAGPSTANRYGFAHAIMAHSAAKSGPSCRVRPIRTSQYPTRARRPANACLDSSKLARMFGIHLPPWQMSLDRCLDKLFITSQGA
jgi:dTDP-4-dehydrorhamnose reductase